MVNFFSTACLSPFEQLVRHLEANDWTVDREEGVELLHTGFHGKGCEFRCAAAITRQPSIVQFVTVFPMAIPADKLATVCEFCARANWGLNLGRFELGHEEKQLRFYTSAPFSNGLLDDEVLRTVIRLNVTSAERYFEAFAGILYAGISAEDAVRLAEEGR